MLEEHLICWELDDPPIFEEMMRAIQKLKNHKAPNGDMMVGEIFKYAAPKVCLEILHQILVEIWNTAHVPTSMGKAIMIALFKKGDSHLCTNYRGITLLSHCLKVISRIINDRLMWYFEEHCFFPESQYGFREKRSTVDMVISLRMIQSAWKEKNIPLYICFIDIAKAYDSVKRELLWKLLERIGIPPKLLRLIQAVYEAVRCSVRFNDFESDFFKSFRESCRVIFLHQHCSMYFLDL